MAAVAGFDFELNGADVKDVAEAVVAGSSKVHLAATASGGGMYPETLCGERVAYGYDSSDQATDGEVCRRCVDHLDKSFPDGVPAAKPMASVSAHLKAAGRAEKRAARVVAAGAHTKTGDTTDQDDQPPVSGGDAMLKVGPDGKPITVKA